MLGWLFRGGSKAAANAGKQATKSAGKNAAKQGGKQAANSGLMNRGRGSVDRNSARAQRGGDADRPGLSARLGNIGWAIGGVREAAKLLDDVVNFPTFTTSVDVSVRGGSRSTMRDIHWMALAIAFGRLDLANVGILPFTIECKWSVTDRTVNVHLEYGLAYIAMAAAWAGAATGGGSAIGGGVTGESGAGLIGGFDVSNDLKVGFGKIIGGVNQDCVGGKPPQWLTSAMKAQGLTPGQFVSGNGEFLGPNFELPQTGKLILQSDKENVGLVAVNPQPPIGDGVRTTLLELIRAALTDPEAPESEYPQRPKNIYNQITKPFERGNKPDSQPPPPIPLSQNAAV